MSLVASYTDSEDEEDFRTNSHIPDNDVKSISTSSTSSESGAQVQIPISSKPLKNALNLFGSSQEEQSDNSEDSSGDNDDDEDDLERRQKLKPTRQQLDNPFRFFGSGNVSAQDSVLRVEFREQEAHKTAVLERHVKMTETAGVAMTINGKKICWNHRKGKCRFGHNCKFAHDSDVLTGADGTPNHPEKNYSPMPSSDEPVKPPNVPYIRKVPAKVRISEETDDLPSTPVFFASSAHLSGEGGNLGKRKKSDDFSDDEGDDSKKSGRDKKKKRPGLTQGLVPGKKAMKMYHNTKDQD